jgi:hypothetical protein
MAIIELISRHPFISGSIIVAVFFSCRYLYMKGYFKRIGLDGETIKKSFADMGFEGQQEEDFSSIQNLGGENKFFDVDTDNILGTEKKRGYKKNGKSSDGNSISFRTYNDGILVLS